MNTTPENFIQRLSALTLTHEKRALMRTELSAYADLYAVSDAIAPSTQKSGTVFDWFTDRRSLYAGAIAVLVLATGSTAAFAAEGTLPGDVLYPVKIHVNEPIAEALATTPQAKAEVSTQLAERRIDEATTLASEGKLDSNTATYLETAVTKQVDTSNSAADELAASGNVAAAATVRASLEDRLSARADALAAAASTTDQNDSAAGVLAVVAEHTHSIALARAASDDAATSTLAIATQAPADFEAIRANARDSAFARSSATLALPEAAIGKRATARMTMKAAVMMGSTTASSTAATTTATGTENVSAEAAQSPFGTEDNSVGNGSNEKATFLPESIAPATAGQ